MPVKNEDKDLVYKSNQLIEAQYCLSAASQKLAATLISRINPNGESLPKFDLSVAEYADLMQISNQAAYKLIDKTTTELKQVVITLRKDNSRSFIKLGMFRECHYDDDEKRVQFEFESRIEPHLRDFAGNFTKYQIGQIRKLKSKYSIRMYEYLRKLRPLRTPKNKTLIRVVSLQELKTILDASSKTYNVFSDFRKFVLHIAQRELSEQTDIAFAFEPIRKGRKIDSLKLLIKHNQKFVEIESDESAGDLALPMDDSSLDAYVENTIRSQLPDINDQEMNLIGMTYSREVILEGLFDLMRALATGNIKGDPINYYMGILKKKRQEDQAVAEKSDQTKTTTEKLTDRSWDENFELDID